MIKNINKTLSNIILIFLITLILSIIITCIEMFILVDILGFKDNIFLLYAICYIHKYFNNTKYVNNYSIFSN